MDGFRVAGVLDGTAVWAEWDGAWVALCEPLYQRALLAIAVDEVFAIAEPEPSRYASTLDGAPVELAITIARSCDALHVITYSFCGCPRTLSFESR